MTALIIKTIPTIPYNNDSNILSPYFIFFHTISHSFNYIPIITFWIFLYHHNTYT
ncbi:CRISPR-associated DxTHG motif protein [Fusobacterium periodonticum]|uniref:CRISPR-associated DxTHG motif protein n=1 Tax=Fusobacterium periodonticum TaxID=860 RepID=UPI001959F4E2